MITNVEKEYLRSLAKQYLEICHSDKNNKKRQKWYDVNDLKEGAVPVFINHYWPLALSEVIPESTYCCTTDAGKWYEQYLRTKMFYALELDDDNVCEPVIPVRMVFECEDYVGLKTEIRRSESDTNESGAYEMIPTLVEEEDIDKVTLPKFTFNYNSSKDAFEEATEVFGNILKPIKNPVTFAAKIPDEYSWFRGMENTYMDIYDDPEWMHKVLHKITENFKERFHLFEEAGVWGTLDLSDPLGSAGLRYASGLPDYKDVDDAFNHKVKLSDSWGFTCAEVFNCVSHAQHDEFAIQYDKEVMGMFKYINVGCCEVLDKKVDLCKALPNTRKVSVSEWCDYETAASNIERNYVYSYRAAGVPFVPDIWDKGSAEKEIRGVLEASKKHGCCTEIVLNIGGTLGANPSEKVIEWSKMVRSLIQEYYPEN